MHLTSDTLWQLLAVVGAVAALLLIGAGVLHVLPRLGGAGRAVAAAMCRAPMLDLVITYFTVLPWMAAATGACRARVHDLVATSPDADALPWWGGVLAAVAGQVVGVVVWTFLHEAANPAARKGPRIVHALNRAVGRFRNHAAVWWTALAVPVFFIVRVAEYVVYPPLTWLVRLPPYRAADWVCVSRQKFRGLVGHDLIWCLYCDWMTGVWSLATEMLRNVESFWCPIRFSSDKKCDNCSVDFPDLNNGWIDAGGDISQAVALVERKYPRGQPHNAWYGHPVRLTVQSKEVPIDKGPGRAG